ncbi:MAG: hypothetical protein S4CHLAM81_04700 [Chlamydiales bacterium]|nr:hypothetical protein [Chlamydiales bacterium]MCH9635259.1 hypothetical protein [Chlamydiales bacterium]MCH9703464.1 hypothetical protein [Chlamydiota bacterium]
MRFILILGFCLSTLFSQEIFLTLDDCVFLKETVPDRGIVCSNSARAMRLSQELENVRFIRSSWGPFVAIGTFNNTPLFVGCAPVGTGSGLLFTELFVAGAKYIVRYGTDDLKKNHQTDEHLVKIVDETDNLIGYNIQSGVAPTELGTSIAASPHMIEVLIQSAQDQCIEYDMCICHHLENYHGLRSPEKFAPERRARLEAILEKLASTEKSPSFDMESAVLFRCAKDFGGHAATILQTVDKTSAKKRPYEGDNFTSARSVEKNIFFHYILEAVTRF